jgi:hypothetical protein
MANGTESKQEFNANGTPVVKVKQKRQLVVLSTTEVPAQKPTSTNFNIAYGIGIVQGVGFGLYETGEAIVKAVSHPIETYNQLEALLSRPDLKQDVKNLLQQQYNEFNAEYNQGDTRGAQNAGQRVGQFAVNLALVADALKTGAKLTVVGGKIIKGKVTGAGAGAGATVRVTSWGPIGTPLDLNPGRWVMVGEATRFNYFNTYLWGPKVDTWRPLKLRPEVPITNFITGTIPKSSIGWPPVKQFYKGFFGQKVIKSPKNPNK